MAKSPANTHEDLSRTEEIKSGSDRSFGLVFAVVFAIIGLWPLTGDGDVRIWSLVVAAGLVVVAFTIPSVLAPLNRLWFRFGLLLSKIMNPLIMGLVFYLTVTPTGFVMRMLGKDLLSRKLDPNARSYWIERTPPGPDPETMQQQF